MAKKKDKQAGKARKHQTRPVDVYVEAATTHRSRRRR